jgi:hypothetical protein
MAEEGGSATLAVRATAEAEMVEAEGAATEQTRSRD